MGRPRARISSRRLSTSGGNCWLFGPITMTWPCPAWDLPPVTSISIGWPLMVMEVRPLAPETGGGVGVAGTTPVAARGVAGRVTKALGTRPSSFTSATCTSAPRTSVSLTVSPALRRRTSDWNWDELTRIWSSKRVRMSPSSILPAAGPVGSTKPTSTPMPAGMAAWACSARIFSER